MDPTHLHLLLNHVPTVGFGVGLFLFIVALIARSHDLKQASLVVFVGVAILSIPAYATGNAAQSTLTDNGVIGDPDAGAEASDALVLEHEGAAFLALGLMELTGALAWLALWRFRRTARLSSGSAAAILVLALVTLGLMAQAAAVGGLINHPEIRPEEAVTTFAGPLARTMGDFVRDTPWTWIAAETIHFVGLTLIMGVILLVNLRMLGVMKQLSFAALDRMLPWAMLGFAANTFTGMLFYAAAHGQYSANPAFYWKLIFIVLAGANTLYFTFDRTWSLAPGSEAPALSKAMAVTAMVLWVGVMYWGSMLPFIGNAF